MQSYNPTVHILSHTGTIKINTITHCQSTATTRRSTPHTHTHTVAVVALNVVGEQQEIMLCESNKIPVLVHLPVNAQMQSGVEVLLGNAKLGRHLGVRPVKVLWKWET